YDFGTPKSVDSVRLQARSFTGQGPKTFKIQYSDDNASWTDALTVASAPTWGSLEARTYTL
ncbi:discoidin domain-containing protein, partial [Pseudomonas sp. CAN2814]